MMPPQKSNNQFVMSSKTLEEVFEENGLNPQKQEEFRKYMLKNDYEGLVKAKICNDKQTKRIWEEATLACKTVLLTRFPVKKGPNQNMTAVIMGSCGNGKTSLMNNICNTQHRVGQQMHSLTRGITMERVLYVQPDDFLIYDTAGTTSDQQVSLHAKLLRATLTHKPLNVIFIHVKFQNRGIDIIKDMLLQLRAIEKYEENVVYLVSHFDMAKDPEKQKTAICQEMKRLRMCQQIVFYSNTLCNKQQLARTLCTICTNYRKVTVKITEEEFLRNFRIGSLDLVFEKEYQERLREIKQIKKIYTEFVKGLPATDEREAIVQDLALSLKYELQQELEIFVKMAQQKIDDTDYFGVFFELQKIILDMTEEFARETTQYRSYGFFGRQTEDKKRDIRDLIKQCPNCGEIWYRIEACPNTTCGHRPSSFWDFIGKIFTRYQVKREGKRLRVFRKEEKKVDQTKIKVDEEFKKNVELSKTQKGNRRGCGASLRFDDLPRLPNIDEILKDWYMVATVGELQAKLKADEIAQQQKEKDDLQIRRNLLALDSQLQITSRTVHQREHYQRPLAYNGHYSQQHILGAHYNHPYSQSYVQNFPSYPNFSNSASNYAPSPYHTNIPFRIGGNREYQALNPSFPPNLQGQYLPPQGQFLPPQRKE